MVLLWQSLQPRRIGGRGDDFFIMAMLKAPGKFLKDALETGIEKKNVTVNEDARDKQFSPEFEALLKEYEKSGGVPKK